MRKIALTLLFVTMAALTFAQVEVDSDVHRPERKFPDPVQTANLWFELVTTGEVDASLGMLSSGTDRKSLRPMFEAFADRGSRASSVPIAIGMKIKDGAAVVHFLDIKSSDRVDIDAMFLVQETIWKVAPIFGGDEVPDTIKGPARKPLEALLNEYMNESDKLPEHYADLLKKKKDSDKKDADKKDADLKNRR